MEGAFVTDTPQAGQQITFARSRIIFGPRATTLCPTTTYTFVTPYGEQSFTTDATGALKRTDGTVSVGCAGPAAGDDDPGLRLRRGHSGATSSTASCAGLPASGSRPRRATSAMA